MAYFLKHNCTALLTVYPVFLNISSIFFSFAASSSGLNAKHSRMVSRVITPLCNLSDQRERKRFAVRELNAAFAGFAVLDTL